MANNRTAITTLPLAAKLNMNLNQEIVNNTYDQLNKQNSSLFGGMLSPIWSDKIYNTHRIFDKHGNSYTYSLNSIRKYEEGSGDNDNILESGHSWFGVVDLSDLPEILEQAVLIGFTETNWKTRTYQIVGTRSEGKDIYVARYNITATKQKDGSDKVVFNKSTSLKQSFSTDSSAVCVGHRLLYEDGKLELYAVYKKPYDTSSIANSESISDNTRQYELDVFTLRFTDLNILGRIQQPFNLERYDNSDTVSTANEFHSTTTNQNVNEQVQIVISGLFTSSLKCSFQYANPSAFKTVYTKWRGVTIYNHRQTGVNAIKDMRSANFLFDESDSTRVQRMCFAPTRLMPGPLYTRWVWDKEYKSGHITVMGRDGTGSNKTMAGYWGSFVDESNDIIIATTYTETNEAAGSTDNDYANLIVDGSEVLEWVWDSHGVYMYTCNAKEGVFNALPTMEENGDCPCNISRLILPTLTTNQRYHRFILAGPNRYKQKEFGYWNAVMVDNMSKTARYYPGIQSTVTLPDSDIDSWQSTDADKQSLWYKRYSNDIRLYNSAGAISTIRNSSGENTVFRVLFNYSTGLVSGISYGNPGDMGTLLTQWDSIDDSFFITSNGSNVLYRDNKTKKLKIIFKSSLTPDIDYIYNNLLSIVAERYLIWNTDAYLNCYDIETGKKGHWASDWNNRILGGIEMGVSKGPCDDTGYFNTYNETGTYKINNATAPIGRFNYYFRKNMAIKELPEIYSSSYSQASGVDISYQSTKTFAPSRLLPYQSLVKYASGSETPFEVTTDEEHPLDFFGSAGTSAPTYKKSFVKRVVKTGDTVLTTTGSLINTVYPTTSSGTAYYNMPLTGIKFVQSYSGKFGVLIGKQGYNILYDGVRPVALYNSTSLVDDTYTFFIVQSQYYAIINNYICAISYNSSNILNGIEQIVNVNGMEFIGAFPSCAYFYSKSSRSIYAFTGDADLQLFVQSDKITNIYAHLYATNNEWIYLYTNDGIYVMTQQNVFHLENLGDYDLIENSENAWKFFSTDQAYNILEDTNGNCYRIAMYNSDGDMNNNKVIFETEYFGPGELRTEVIDCWYIRFCKKDFDSNGEVRIYAKVLNGNVVTETEEDSFIITDDKWDSNGMYLYRFQPNVQNAEGFSLHLESDYPVYYIGFSHSSDTTVVTPNVEDEPVLAFTEKSRIDF